MTVNGAGQAASRAMSPRPEPDLVQLLTPEGGLHRPLNVFLNDDDIRYLGRLDAKVSQADTLTLMPAVAGG